jgi:hypothetical protein
MGPLEPQERNVEVFDSGGVVIAGIFHSLVTSLPLFIDDCSILTVSDRVNFILKITRCFGGLDHFSMRSWWCWSLSTVHNSADSCEFITDGVVAETE